MTDKLSKLAPYGILIGIIAGAALGAVVPGFMQAIDFIGRLFINALQVVVIPLIVAAIISGVALFGDLPKIGRTASRIVLYFVATSAIAVIIGLALVLIINPGDGVSAEALQAYGSRDGYHIGNISDMLSALIPFNLAAGIVGGQYLGLILFSIIAGGILATMGAGARTVTTFFRQLNDTVMKLVQLLLFVAPLGVFSIVGSAVASGLGSVEGLTQGFGWYALTILIGLLIHALVVLPIIVRRFTGRSAVAFLHDMSPALITALGTGSSAATLPVTFKCAVEEGRVDHRAGALVLPLGAVANLNGTAMSVIIASIFLANVFSVPLSAFQIVLMVVTTLFVSIGAAGMPMATPIITTIVLGVAGFTPFQILAGTSLIMALDWLVDRGRAVVDVWGDAVGAVVIAETFEFKTARRAGGRTVDDKHEEARSPRTRTDRDRGRPRQDSRVGRITGRGPSGPRDSRISRPVTGKPTPQDRGPQGRPAPREVESESPFGITGASTPMLDIEGSTPPKDASKPDMGPDRQPYRGRPHEEAPRSVGAPNQRESVGDKGRSRRPERETTDSTRQPRRPISRDRKPIVRKPEDTRPPQRRDSRPPTPVEAEPQPQATAPRQVEPTTATTPPEAVVSNGRLSPATVARELARVSAQLAGAAAAEQSSKPAVAARPDAVPRDRGPEPRVTATGPERLSPDSPSSEPERQDRSFPSSSVAVKIAASSPNKEVASPEPPAPAAEAGFESRLEAVGSDKPDSGPEGDRPHFGRSRSHRGPRPAHDNAPKPVRDEIKSALPTGYSTESATFGRGKKKRVR